MPNQMHYCVSDNILISSSTEYVRKHVNLFKFYTIAHFTVVRITSKKTVSGVYVKNISMIRKCAVWY